MLILLEICLSVCFFLQKISVVSEFSKLKFTFVFICTYLKSDLKWIESVSYLETSCGFYFRDHPISYFSSNSNCTETIFIVIYKQ